MYHLKGIRFGFPIIKRLGILSRLGTHTIRWNSHPAPEIHFILKGQSAWELSGQDAPLRLSGGSFAVIPSGLRHRALEEHGMPAIRIGITLERLNCVTLDGSPFLPDDIKALYAQLEAHACKAYRMSAQLSFYVHEFFKTAENPSISSAAERLHLRILASALLNEADRNLANSNAPLLSCNNVITSICSWIDSHCTETSVTPERLVSLSGYGRSQFFSLFLKETGMTPRDYILRTRIAEAKRRMKKPQSITSIALACGFPSAAAFSTAFRRHTGLSPSFWKFIQTRQQHAEDSNCNF